MPYIGLQLIGLKTVIAAIGIKGDWPIIIAFVVLAAYTYQSGLRAPELTAIIKDIAIYVTVVVAIIYITIKLGGFGHIFDGAGSSANLAVTIVLTPLTRALDRRERRDETAPEHYVDTSEAVGGPELLRA